MNLTEKEKTLLEGIFKSCYHDGSFPIENPVWVDHNDFNFPADSISGVMASIVKKGLVRTDGETCNLTKTAAAFFPSEEKFDKMTRSELHNFKIE